MATQPAGYVAPPPSTPFPRAHRYAHLGRHGPCCVHENDVAYRTFAFTERHLQCVWADPSLRPARLTTASGETVTVENPGIWNLEAGPDFLGAVLRLGPDERRVSGDVEIHIRASGWKGHGHHLDPRYRNVRCHVTYFPGQVEPGLLPPGTVELALKPVLQSPSTFSFDAIDLTAYPYGVRADVPPCSEVLSGWSRTEIEALLTAAGEERLRRKAERIAAAIEEQGPGQALYGEVLCALGYKHNKAAFRQVAERVPLAALRREAGSDVETAYALLSGVAGLLPAGLHTGWDAATRSFVRRIWDRWWKLQHRWGTKKLPEKAWRLSGLRPANHPLRRLMAAAYLFAGCDLIRAIQPPGGEQEPAAFLHALYERLTGPTHTYWDNRLSLSSGPKREKVGLIGPQRARAIMINVIVPFWAATVQDMRLPPKWLNRLPSDAANSIVRQTAYWLFGPDHSPALYRNGLRRQGLMQIFHDFCLNDRSRCAQCAFPRLLKTHQTRFEL